MYFTDFGSLLMDDKMCLASILTETVSKMDPDKNDSRGDENPRNLTRPYRVHLNPFRL